MKKVLFACALALAALVSCNKGDKDPRLVIITFDGLRWQEVFSGAEEGLVGNATYVADPEALKTAYWRDTPEERRETLLPFLWSYVPQNGYFLGNRNKGSRMSVSNTKNYSYPGYSEMFCGYADDERVDSNDPVVNPNTNVLEVAARDPRYQGQIMMLSSWESIRYAIANERAGIPGSSAHEPCYVETEETARLQAWDDSGVENFGSSERMDLVTAGFALEVIKNAHPKVFYVGFGDTDEYAHSGKYDNYLDAAHGTDEYIRQIVETCEADPFYKGKTTYILTCDHGRGHYGAFTSHGAGTRYSNETWFIAFGKGIPALGETQDNGPFYTKQFAGMIASILGIDFTPDNGVKVEPFDPSFHEAPLPPTAEYTFKAVQDAAPKGNGLRYTYSEGDYLSVVPFLKAPVKKTGITPVLTTDMKLREDHFGLVLKGLMKIPADGLYELAITSDDGSKLFFDGQLLFDIDRDGGGVQSAWMDLEAGYHRLEVQYFENYGGEALEIGIEGPGVSYFNLPADMLFYE